MVTPFALSISQILSAICKASSRSCVEENGLVRLAAEVVQQLHHFHFAGKIKKGCRFIR